MEFKLCSSAFAESESLPEWYYSDSINASPPIGWDGEPNATESLALICRSSSGIVHWVCWNIPNTLKTIYGMQPGKGELPGGMIQGVNGFGNTGWTGPSKEDKGSSLVFQLYAIDRMLEMTDSGAGVDELVEAMKEHLLKGTTLTCECS